MSKQPVIFGPWSAGLNSTDDEKSISAHEVADVSNIEFANDGSANLRRPHRVVGSGAEFRLMGIVPIASAGFEASIGTGIIYRQDTDLYLIYPSAGEFGTFIQTKLNSNALHNKLNYAFEYAGKYYALSTDPTKDSYVSSAIGPVASTWSVLPGPAELGGKVHCDTYSIYLDRLFLATRVTDTVTHSNIYFSSPGNFADWSTMGTGGSFEVGSGSGGRVNFFHVMYNMLYIFTKFATFSYTYNTDPNADGTLQPVGKQGANLGIYFNDKLYLVSDTGLYQFINNNYYAVTFNSEIKYYGITCLKAFDSFILISSTIPEVQTYVLNTDTGALSKWDLQDNLIFDTKGTTELYATGMDAVLNGYTFYTTQVSGGTNTLSCFPTRYAFIPQNEFYDQIAVGGVYYPYSAWFKAGLMNFKMESQYKRIYYCTGDMEAYGFYDGATYVNDSSSGMTTKLGMHITSETKMRYPIDRMRVVQPILSYAPTEQASVTKAQRLPLKFRVNDFQLLVEAKDVQQGERV